MLQNYESKCFPNMNDLTLVSCGDQVVYHSRVLAQPRAFNCRLNPFSLEAFLIESVFHLRELGGRGFKGFFDFGLLLVAQGGQHRDGFCQV